MVLDIKLFRAEQGGDPELIRESQRRRHKPVEIVDEIIALDEKWRKDTFQLDNLRKEQRIISKQIGELNQKGNKEEAATLSKRAKDMRTEIDALIISVDQTKVLVDKKLSLVGNIVHESVPVSNNEDDNALYHQFGEYNKKENANKNHRDLLHMIDGFDPVRGHKVAGHRGYFLKGMGVRLSQAIISYASDFLIQREYTLLQTPLFMKKEVMAQTAQLEQFDEELYKVVESHGEHADKEFYLIATSEQPISAFHADEWLQPNELPLRYGGISSCFRKEAGAAGKDTWGIFRVHQFDKVEQFVVTAPETSWQEHEKMMEVSEQFWQSLEIPYRVVTIVSAELNNAASKKYDLEGWFPGSGEFRELVSCSNCTDYQSRSLEVRCGTKAKEDKEKKYVHMLNSTLCALTRTICVILENHQTETGVTVPKALRNYMGGLEFMPFVLPQPPPPDQPNTVKPGDVKKAAAGGKKEGGEQKKQGGGGGEQKKQGGGGGEQKKKEGGEQQKKQGGGDQKKKEGGAQQGKGKGQQQGKGQEKKEEKTEAKTEAKTEEKKEEKTEEKKEQAPAEVKTESAVPKEQTTEQK